MWILNLPFLKLSKHLKGHKLIGLDISAKAKLVVISIINPRVFLHSEAKIGFDLPCVIFLMDILYI